MQPSKSWRTTRWRSAPRDETLSDVLARLEGVRPCSGGYVARCPGHEDSRPSLSIREGDNGHALMKCFRGCPYEAIATALDSRPWRRTPDLPRSNLRALDDVKRTEIARRIWRESKPATGTLAEAYLRSRGITMPVPPTLRFHSALKHPSGPVLLPAMVAVVSDLNCNVVAVHRTYLDGQGNRSEPGTAESCARPDCRPRGSSRPGGRSARARRRYRDGPERPASDCHSDIGDAWYANLSRVDLPDCVRELIICVDADPVGEQAAGKSATSFMHEGRRVRIARPQGGKDFNEMRL